jgi:hypothetical protein
MPDAAPDPLAPLVARLSEEAGLNVPAQALRDPSRGPREFIAALDGAEHHVDALKFLAHLLPRREAVWWAWMCAKKEAGDALPPVEQAALQATERWIAQPTDEHRREAMRAAEAATFETPAGCAALAVFLAGGSLAPPGVAETPPSRFAAAKAVFGSLVFSAVAKEPHLAPDRYRRFLSYGMELADRIRLWEGLQRSA